MFSIQKFFAKDDQFLELLMESAKAGRASVQALKTVLQNPAANSGLEAFVAVRRQDKALTSRISELLVKTSITSLDPEDIEAISVSLYKVPKTVVKIAERCAGCADHLKGVDFSGQLALVEQATDTVVQMIGSLEKSKFEEVTAANDKLQAVEGDADKLMVRLLNELYNSTRPPMSAIVIKDIYELLEKVVDRCRDVGSVVATVVLKHS